jgi:hypothetical protein
MAEIWCLKGRKGTVGYKGYKDQLLMSKVILIMKANEMNHFSNKSEK